MIITTDQVVILSAQQEQLVADPMIIIMDQATMGLAHLIVDQDPMIITTDLAVMGLAHLIVDQDQIICPVEILECLVDPIILQDRVVILQRDNL